MPIEPGVGAILPFEPKGIVLGMLKFGGADPVDRVTPSGAMPLFVVVVPV